MQRLSLLDAAGKIYMIGIEFHGDDEEREPVSTWDAKQQCGVEWTRLPLETRAALDRNWHFYLRFTVWHEHACADADYAFGVIVDALRAAAAAVSAVIDVSATTSAELLSPENFCANCSMSSSHE